MAFGTNLLGAIFGGCLEYLSLVLGYRGLLIIATGLYLSAYLLMPADKDGGAVIAPLLLAG